MTDAGSALETTRLRVRPPSTMAAALAIGAGPHVLPVLDIGSTATGDVEVVVPAPAVLLVELLADGAPLSTGEVVTVLVPLARTLAELHDAGVAHGGITTGAVEFDVRGAPVLARFDRAVLRAPGVLVDPRFETTAEADDVGLRDLAAGLLRRSGAAGRVMARRVLDEELIGEGMVEALFALAAPEPVRLRRALWQQGPAPGRLLPVGAAPDLAMASAPGARPAVRATWRRASAALRGVRRRVWAAAAASAVLLLAGVALLPARDADAETGGPSDAPTRTKPSVTGSRAPARVVRAEPELVHDDPVAAVGTLLRLRAACIGGGNASCLHGVDAADSPVAAEDEAALAGGVEPAQPRGHPVLRDRIGSSASVLVGTATVVVVRDPVGWRLRDVMVPTH